MGSVIKLIARMLSGLLNALRITTVQEDLFVNGKSFSWDDYLTFGADEVKTIVFDSSAFTGDNLTFNPVVFAATGGPVRADFYTGTTSNADGTILGASNRREGEPGPQSILRLNPTGLSLGTLFAGDAAVATGAGVGNVNPGANMPGLPFEIDASINHAIQFTNDDGAGVVVPIKITWFES